jgi:Tol biopolymer transport system component
MLFVALLLLAGCDVPKPPPELPTPSPGSSNPEEAVYSTPVRATPDRGFTPIATGPGHIYFVRDERLWTVEPDGSGAKPMSELPATGKPQPSPDGRNVAWIGGNDLYVMPTGGGEARKIFSGSLPKTQRIGWTHDGTLVGVVAYDLDTIGAEHAWAVPVDGGEPVLIADLPGSSGDLRASYERTVEWSADGYWVVAGGPNNPFYLRRWPLTTGHEGDVREIAGGEPDWSPDSKTLLYTESLSGAVLIYGVLEGEATPFRNEKQLVGTGLGEHGQGPGPLWSPASVGSDSDLLVYRSRSLSGEPNIAVRTRGGRDLSSLPNLTNNAAWSPSGDRLVVETGTMRSGPLGPEWKATGLAIARISPAGEHTLTPLAQDGQWPAWGR